MSGTRSDEPPWQRLRPDAPIEPNVGLGGLTLRVPITSIEDIALALLERYDGDWGRICEVYPLWEARYLLGPICACADIRSGRIFKLIADTGYTGALFGTIRVGMPLGEALRLEPRLYYDEDEGLLLVRDCPGVALDILARQAPSIQLWEAASLELLADGVIAAIAVFAPEIVGN
ncbi:MAG: hypothetical protein ABI068_02105 [Ktedonobacterales bacterium]